MTEKGLYRQQFEHDACGIGAVVNVDGTKSHKVVDNALSIVEKLEHRAGKDASGETGDGVGILVQISHKFFKKAAKEIGATAVALTCNRDSLIASVSDIAIVTDTGEEVVTGSTRMKAGTAHKMVLNMITTCSMIKQGKVYENMMINLKPTNIKLKQRMINIVCEICDCDAVKAENLLRENDFDIRRAANAYKG